MTVKKQPQKKHPEVIITVREVREFRRPLSDILDDYEDYITEWVSYSEPDFVDTETIIEEVK